MNENQLNISVLKDEFDPASVEDQKQLEQLLADVNQQYTLRRYQMISDVLHNEMPQRLMTDFSQQVMQQISLEPAVSVATQVSTDKPSESPRGSWLSAILFKPLAGFALAATVAAVVVVGVQQNQNPLQDEATTVAQTESDSSFKLQQLANLPVVNNSNALRVSAGSEPQLAADPVLKIKRNDAAVQQKLNTYLINHNEYASSLQGIIPQVRVVGYDSNKQ